MHFLRSVKGHNIYGNILTGVFALALGAAWLLDSTELTIAPCALLLLVSSGISFVVCLTVHEMPDEMAREHEGISSGVALKALMLLCALMCCESILTRRSIELAPACCLCIGFGLLVYGITFAVLERNDGEVHYQDA